MNDLNQDDVLDRRLREAAPYIDDNGFTARVLAQLPAVRPAQHSFRAVILIGITLLASVLTYFLSDGGRFINEGVARLTGLPISWLLLLTFSAGVVLSLVGLAAAMSKSRELSL